MKKLRLNVTNLVATEILSREELKKVLEVPVVVVEVLHIMIVVQEKLNPNAKKLLLTV